MEVDSSASKKRSREDSSITDNTSPPTKKQKTATNTAIKPKESTPPLVMDEDDKKTNTSSNSSKPPLIATPSSGNIEKRSRDRKPGLAKVPSTLLEFNGLIAEKEEARKKKISDKQEAEDEKEEKKEEKKENEVDINRQKAINDVKELLAPCSRELIQKRKISCVIWFDSDDDGNICLWIAKIMESKFDEADDITSMLVQFPGYNDKEIYWLPIIFKNKWLVYQPNHEILLSDKYTNLWHKNNFEQCKNLLTESNEYLSDMSDSDDDIDYIFENIKNKNIKKKKRKNKKKRVKKKDRIKTKRKKAETKRKTVKVKPKTVKKKPATVKYSHGNKRLQNLDECDTTKISFTPISMKHPIGPATDAEIDNELIEILFSFDTTGSMSSCLESLKGNLKNILELLFRDIPKIRIGILAHGDYCDENIYYVMRWIDLTDNKNNLIKFVDDTQGTGGGDAPECYELVMHNACRQMTWSNNCVNRSLVLIGDENPHELGYGNPYKLDWREKVKDCKSCGIKIYGVHCLGNFSSKNFYQTISDMTNGVYVTLDKIQSFAGMMVALCHREKDLINMENMNEEDIKKEKEEKKEYDKLYEQLNEFSVLGLKEMLRFNGQKVGGTKGELIGRVVDCQMYGCMPRCGECGGGHLRVIYINGKKYGHQGKGRYFCPGFYNGDEYCACLWSGDETKIKREKWREIDDNIDDNDDDNAHNKNK